MPGAYPLRPDGCPPEDDGGRRQTCWRWPRGCRLRWTTPTCALRAIDAGCHVGPSRGLKPRTGVWYRRAADRQGTDMLEDDAASTVETAADQPTECRTTRAHLHQYRALPWWAFVSAVFAVWWLAQCALARAFGGGVAASMLRFDGSYYLDIAHRGYVFDSANITERTANTNFFPALPWISMPFLRLGDSSGVVATSLVVSLCAFLGVFRAAELALNTRTAKLSVATLACWPGSVWLWAFYSEGIFVATSSWALWAARSRRWVLASGLLFAASLSRTIGVLFGLMLVVMHVRQARRFDRIALAYSVSSVAGLGAVMVTQWIQVGDPLAFQKSQSAWGRQASWPWTPVLDGLSQIADRLPGLAVEATANAAVMVFFLVAGAAWWAWSRQRPDERPVEIGVWTFTAMLFPLFSSDFGSLLRYAMAGWTCFVEVGYVLTRAPRWLRAAALA